MKTSFVGQQAARVAAMLLAVAPGQAVHAVHALCDTLPGPFEETCAADAAHRRRSV
jgi:hypothetical protein